MPPKRDIYVNIMDPVEKQNIKIEKSKKRCSCKRCLCVSFFFRNYWSRWFIWLFILQ